MQQLNVAYEANDLLQLLELQLRFEQIDEAKISTLADDRLDHYNKLLAEQVFQLKVELAEIEAPWRAQLELPPAGKLSPAKVRTQLEADLRNVAKLIERSRRDLDELAVPSKMKEWLQEAMAAQERRNRELLARL
jgi:hypothetical protein